MRDIALLTIVIILVPWCIARPWIGALAWNWIGLMNPHRLTFGFAYAFPWAMVVGGAFLVGLLFTKDRKPIPWNAQLVLMVVLLGYFAFTSVFAWVPEVAWGSWNQIMKVILMAVLTSMVIYGKVRIRWLLLVIALSVGFYGVKGGIWVIVTGGAERVHGPLQSFMSQSNGIGLGLVMVIPLLFALAREETRAWLRHGLFIAGWLSVLAAIFTYSRGAMLGVAVIAPLLLFKSRQKVVALAVSMAAVAAFVAFAPAKLFEQAESIQAYEQDRSAMQRLMSWSVALGIAAENPFTGAGINFESHPDEERWASYGNAELRVFTGGKVFSQHSIYFQILGDHGFLALALFLVLLVSTLVKLQKIKRRLRGTDSMTWLETYADAIQISLVGYMIAGAFLSLAYFDLAWTLYALTAILEREYRRVVAGDALTGSVGTAPVPIMPAAGAPNRQALTGVAGRK